MARRKKRFPFIRFLMKSVMFVLVIIGIALITLMLLPADKIASIASARFEAATGRAMLLEGDVRPSIWPEFGVKTGRVTIANADWSESGAMLDAESLAIGVDLAALIVGDIRITNVEAVAPKVILEIAADGRANWTFDAPEPATIAATTAATGGSGDLAAPVAGVRAFTLDRATVSDAQISFVNHQSGVRQQATSLDGVLSLPEFNGVADISLSGQLNGQPVKLDAEISDFAAFLEDGAVPVTLLIDVAAETVNFEGRAGLVPLAATGAIVADLGTMTGVFNALGMASPDLPYGLGRNIGMSGDVSFIDETVSLRGGSIQFGNNRLVGAADLALSGKPKLVAKLSAGALDFAGLADAVAPTGTSGGGATSGDSGWSKERIDVSALGLLDAEVSIEADSVALGPTNLGQTRITTTLEDRRAVVQVTELKAYDGAIKGIFVANGRSGLSVSADMEGRAVALKPLLSELAGFERLIAAGDMEIDVLGTGNSMDAIMRSLNGQGSFTFGAGAIEGLDLVGMLRNFDAAFVGAGVKTIFESVSGTFRIENGVLINENLSLKSPLLNATGTGEIGLGGQTINYRLVPQLLKGDQADVRVPLLITGTWAAPKFKLDLKSLADEKLEAERVKIEQRAKEELNKKVQEKLGVTPQEGQSTEDALKKELEKRATEGLLKLLGKK